MATKTKMNISALEILTRLAEKLPEAEQLSDLAVSPQEVKDALLQAISAVRLQTTSPRSPLTDPVELNPNKILVVDDQPSNRRLLELMLRDTDFQVLTVGSSLEALEVAHAERPFLVISDVQMPEINGFELCRRLKSDPLLQHIAVIFVTAHQRSAKHIKEGLDIGGDDYITRPFQREELLARVHAVTRLKLAEAEARHQAHVAAWRNRKLEFLNRLAMAISSTPDATPETIFRDSLRQLAGLLVAEATALLLFDAQSARLHTILVTEQGEQYTAVQDFRVEGENLALAIQEQASGILAHLIAQAEIPLSVPPTTRAIPMASREHTIGALAIINKHNHNYTTADWTLLTSTVGLITLTVENMRLWQSAKQQVQDLTLLNRVGQALSSSLDLTHVLSATTDMVRLTLDAEVASLWRIDEEAHELKLIVASGPNTDSVVGYRLLWGTGIVGYVADTGESYLTGDADLDERHFAAVDEISSYHARSILCVPLIVKERVIGVIQALHRQPHQFDAHDLQLFQLVANSVSIAVENAELFEEVRAFNQQLEHMVAERTQELLAEKEKTVAILHGMADGLLVLDPQHRLLTVNQVAEEMLKSPLSEQIGQVVDWGKRDSPLWCGIDRIIAGEEPSPDMTFDLPDSTQPEEVRSIQARVSRIYDEAGKLIGTTIVLRDVTALKAVERAKSRFMAGVTHELKTPLAVIKMHVNNLAMYYKRLPARKRESLFQSIQQQVALLEQLIEGILELSRHDAGTVEVHFQPINLVSLLNSLVPQLMPLAKKKRLKLVWSPPKGDVWTRGDPVQLERVFRNLIDNAIKYTPEKGHIQVSVFEERQDTRLFVGVRVQDNGIGIPAEAQAHLFERFYRVDPSHTIPGTGLGLSIVKEIVEQHGGTIRVTSEAGKGSTFEVLLPENQA